MNRLGITIVTFTLVIGSASGASGQEEDTSPSPAVATTPEPATSAPTWLDEQTCVDPDFQWPMSTHGKTVGGLLDCAKTLGLKEGDPDYDAYDFTLMERLDARERHTQQCDEAGTHIGTRYRAWGTDSLYRDDKPSRAVNGTFDFTVVRTLMDPDTDTWRVETEGVIWDLHSTDGDLAWTWSVEMMREADGTPDTPRPDRYAPQLDLYRGLERDAFGVFCEYLK